MEDTLFCCAPIHISMNFFKSSVCWMNTKIPCKIFQSRQNPNKSGDGQDRGREEGRENEERKETMCDYGVEARIT